MVELGGGSKGEQLVCDWDGRSSPMWLHKAKVMQINSSELCDLWEGLLVISRTLFSSPSFLLLCAEKVTVK